MTAYFLTYSHENNGRAVSEQTVKLHEIVILHLLIGTVNVELLDALHGQFFMLQTDLVGIRSKFACVTVDMGRESGGKEHNLNGARKHAASFVSGVQLPKSKPGKDSRFDADALITHALLVQHVIGLI